MKRLMLAMLLLALPILIMACATMPSAQDCEQVGYMFTKMPECATGWGVMGITGHGPSCADEQTMTEIRGLCPGFE